MDIKIFLIFMVILCVAQQGPVAYRGLTCVEPEVGYMERMINYFFAPKSRENVSNSRSFIVENRKRGLLYRFECNGIIDVGLHVCVCTVGWKPRKEVLESHRCDVPGMESSSIPLSLLWNRPVPGQENVLEAARGPHVKTYGRFREAISRDVDVQSRTGALCNPNKGATPRRKVLGTKILC
ncbi:uncharacterized protein [Argopecten irradians]|uniref:uncharacterized protein n=1 Tax=Argopecten irradians TaxID=31199 RepID=UPI00371EFB6F